jgi:hypothetical protein
MTLRTCLFCLLFATATGCSEPSTPADTTSASDVVQDTETDTVSDVPTDAVPEVLPDVPPDIAPDTSVTPVWGWISVIEWNDTCDQWNLKTKWLGGVRAQFATEPSWPRALPHTLGFMKPVATVGNCTLYDPGLMTEKCMTDCLCLDKGIECYNADETERWCGDDEMCVESDLDFHGICQALPAHYSVGTLSLQGLKQPLALTPDEFDRYMAPQLTNPDDLFDKGDVITATTSGGDLPPMTFTAKGVAPLDLITTDIERPKGAGKAVLVKWKTADPDARVQVAIQAGSHDPNPLAATILCDVPDSDGQVSIDGSLFDKAHVLSCNGQWLQKCSRVTRYTRDRHLAGGKEVELFVGSARNLKVLW